MLHWYCCVIFVSDCEGFSNSTKSSKERRRKHNMKTILIAFCGLLILGVDASPYSSYDSAIQLKPECAKGPVFWCENLWSAKSCGAVTHCIQTVWEKQTYPEDHDSICKICLDMVKQARDQLQSNETQEDLKAVFEGTCAFIRIKKIREECDKMADELVPELVEALSSQMNPQVVCSVSGLCNNAAIDKELAIHSNELAVEKLSNGLTCKQCHTISDIISTKFTSKSRDDILENMLMACGQMSSLSDGCSAIVLSYFNEVYDHLKTNLNAENICHMAGVCADQFHVHDEDTKEIEITVDSQTGVVDRDGDDIPCDLCKQLIVHLRDLLVANTTEAEFKNVLEGICKQTKSFKSECLSLADQYYDVIYARLTHNLDPDGACFMIGICPKGLAKSFEKTYEVAPLVPNTQLLVKKKLLGENEPVLTNQEIQYFQLPKDVLLLNTEQLQAHIGQKKSAQFCTLCEYFLHFMQDALASPKNEENIKQSVLSMCEKVKKPFQSDCQSFVDMYGDAVIAMIIQDIDPSQVCPKLSLCARTTSSANEKCPLCLFLVQDLEDQLQHNRSKENIENKLHLLCSRLKDDLKAECDDFINTYTAELVDKLAKDFSPREICLYLKLCTEKEEYLIENIGDKAAYNDYLTNTVYEIEPQQSSAPECILCEQLVKKLEKQIANDKSRDHIKKVLEEICVSFPKAKLKNKCKAAIEKNADYIVDLILKEVTPKEICSALGFCFAQHEFIELIPLSDVRPKPSEYTCRFCQIVVAKIEEQLNNKTAQEDVENCVKHICIALPSKLQPKCKRFIDAYADEIIKHFPSESPKQLCEKTCACKGEVEVQEEPEEIVESAPECLLCEQLVKEVEKKAQNDKSKEHIKEVLEEACAKFRKPDLKEKCDEVVEKNADYIVNSIIKQLSPKEICHGLGFCAVNPNSEIDARIEQVATQMMEKYSDTPQCVLCQLIATKLEADLKNAKTQDEIENSVRKVCHALPSKYAVKCKKFIDEYAELVISLLTTVPPKELCSELNFCVSSMKKDTNQRDVLECGICNTAVDALGTVLQKNGPKEREIVAETTCHLLPAKYYDQCHELMKVYGVSLTILIKRSEKRGDICVQVGKCFRDGDSSMFVEINEGKIEANTSSESDESIESSESGESQGMEPKQRLIGANNSCTNGPSYWCSSDETMNECNAREFCETRYFTST